MFDNDDDGNDSDNDDRDDDGDGDAGGVSERSIWKPTFAIVHFE